MIFKRKKMLVAGLSMCLSVSLMAGPAMAMEYTYEGNAPGESFFQSTSTDQNYIADNGQIVVGTDGTVSSGVTGNQTSGPLSSVNLPVGEYPEAWGFETDVAIAANAVYPNELGPTTQNSNYYRPTFTPTVDSGALPTGNSYIPSAYTPIGYAGGFVLAPYATYAPLSAYGVSLAAMPYGNGQYLGLATNAVGMPTITRGGAIGRLSVPSIGLNKYIYEGTSQANMKKGIAHFDSTSGWLGNVALAGHNRGGSYAAFANLKDVSIGDTVSYTTAYGTLTYVVSNITTVATTDTSGLQQNGQNKLTMYTCKANQPDVKLCVTATMVGTNV